MPRVDLATIDKHCRVTLGQVREFERISLAGLYRRMDSHELAWAIAPNEKRGPKFVKIVDARSMTEAARKRWAQWQISAAAEARGERRETGEQIQDSKCKIQTAPAPLALPADSELRIPNSEGTPTRRTSADQVEFAFAALPEVVRQLPIPREHQEIVCGRHRMVTENRNGDWRKRGYGSKVEYLKALAAKEGVSLRSIYRWTQWWDRGFAAGGDGGGYMALLGDKPGRDPRGGQLEPWAEMFLRQQQMDGFSNTMCYRRLVDERKARQRAFGIGHPYNVPTRSEVMKFLRAGEAMARALGHGSKAFDDQFGAYISRDYSNLKTNDLWVTDQRLCNVRLRDGGERLGRVWVVNVIDVASRRWLGCWFGPVLSSDMVMGAAVMAITRAGVPKAIHEDRGKEFNCRAFNGSFRRISGDTLFREIDGVWDRLGVRVVQAIGENPKSKIIEAWHRNLDEFDKNFTGHGWCGSNTDERPERLAEEEARHEAWKKTGAGHTPLARIEQYVAAYLAWCEAEYNARHEHRGRGMNAMTPCNAPRSFPCL